MNSNYRNRIYPVYTSTRMPQYLEYSSEKYESDSRSILRRFGKWLPKNKEARCLDVACGPGQFLYALRKFGYQRVAGIDISPQQVAVASKVCDEVILMDILDYLKSHRNEFDFIAAIDIIEHFTKNEIFPLLDALFNALRPGGRLVIQTPNAESPWGFYMRSGDFTHEVSFESSSLESVLSLVGFADYQARSCDPIVHGVKSLGRWVAWRIISFLLLIWNLAETGTGGSGIYTRVFIAKVDKKD